VQFGDGKTGARLPSGVKNVAARYRTGQGAHGALKTDTNVQPKGKLQRLDKLRLPGVASGGAEPESGDKARQAAPGKIQSLDRLVSLGDFETETLAVPGVRRAAAAWEIYDNVPAVVLTVLMESGRDGELAQVRATLATYNRCRGPQRFPIIVKAGQVLPVYLDASFALDPTFREELVRKAIEAALGVAGEAPGNGDGLFTVGRRRFGAREYASRVAATIQKVAGVLWAKVNGFGPPGPTPDPTADFPPSPPWPLNETVDCAPDRILALDRAQLELNPVAPPPTEGC
jgi:predicted phage baseplate assembly protein